MWGGEYFVASEGGPKQGGEGREGGGAFYDEKQREERGSAV